MTRPGKILRVHISETDRFAGKPLYEAIVERCRELKIAGATVFLGLEGYGETAAIHKAHIVKSDRPVVITIVDAHERIEALIPVVAGMLETGLIASSEVEMIRVEKDA